MQNEANEKREEVYKQKIEDLGPEVVTQIKKDHHNAGLTNLVLNRDELTKVYEIDLVTFKKRILFSCILIPTMEGPISMHLSRLLEIGTLILYGSICL